MKKISIFIFTLLFSCFSFLFSSLGWSAAIRRTNSHSLSHPKTAFLVRLSPAFNADLKHRTTFFTESGLTLVDDIIPSLGIYLVQPQKEKMTRNSQLRFLQNLKQHPAIQYIQEDHPIRWREKIPPVSLFERQWSLKNPNGADIKATLAWDFGVGGKDYFEQDLVVAVVDSGVETSHPDLKSNIWVNPGEIPNNGIDDDGNGYIDDVYGWNVTDNSGQMRISDPHGTMVAGIIGASGANSSRFVGVNWKTKILALQLHEERTSEVAKAYGYIIAMKKLWAESKGKKGANIVVTNSSFGIDKAKCTEKDFPIWNDLYDAMGQYGILSAVAGPNLDVDVDVIGDVPTTCSSDFLVKVTNTNSQDQKYWDAGVGLKNIHLGAPGTQIWSTYPGGRIDVDTGTSFSCPHVTGAIALMHSVAGKTFSYYYKIEPSAASLLLKRLLLEKGIDLIPALQGKTTTGGRLNLFKALQAIINWSP